MKRYVDSATVVKYNANTRGTSTGDCTTRAISLAFNMDYPKVRKLQNESCKTNRIYPFNNLENCKKVISALGGGPMITVTGRVTVEEFADSHSGTYIIYCGKYESSSRRTHLVCIINDRIYDSWDSRGRFVKGYWEIRNGIRQEHITDIQPVIKQKLITDRDINYYNELVGGMMDRIISKNRKIKKLQQESDFGISLQLEIYRITLKDYTFTLTCDIDVIYGGNIRAQTYPGKIVVVFKPTMKADEIDDYFYETFFNKFYSYLYNIIAKIEDTCEGVKLLGDQPRNYKGIAFYDMRDKKSFDSLPYWVKSLATNFYIDSNRWGYEECRTIVLNMKRPKFDTKYDPDKPNETVYFRSDSMDSLREGLKHYQETGDYDSSYSLAHDY